MTTKKATARKAASKKGPGPMRLLERDERQLEVELSEKELAERSHLLAVTHRALRELADVAEDWKKQHKAREQEVKSRQARLADEVETGRCYRDVVVEVRADDVRGEAVAIRTDTGEELSRRALTQDEAPGLFGSEDDDDGGEP